jgi:hypothetical protein
VKRKLHALVITRVTYRAPPSGAGFETRLIGGDAPALLPQRSKLERCGIHGVK